MEFRFVITGETGERRRGRRKRKEKREREVGGHTFEDPYGRGEIVDSSRCFEGGGDDRGGRNKIVGESIV